jgi:hypothetical protein
MEEGQPRSDVACHSQARCVRNMLFVAVEHRIEITPLAQLEYKTEGPVLIRMPTLLLASHPREKASLPFHRQRRASFYRAALAITENCAENLLLPPGLDRSLPGMRQRRLRARQHWGGAMGEGSGLPLPD